MDIALGVAAGVLGSLAVVMLILKMMRIFLPQREALVTSAKLVELRNDRVQEVLYKVSLSIDNRTIDRNFRFLSSKLESVKRSSRYAALEKTYNHEKVTVGYVPIARIVVAPGPLLDANTFFLAGIALASIVILAFLS